MEDLTYRIEFYDYWNTSSGLSGGAFADTLCLKDKNGLPYLPGKTVKGLFREAAELLLELKHKEISKEFIEDIFGERERQTNDPNSDKKTAIAKAYFTNANLNVETANAITYDLSPFLYESIASTALEPTGIAKRYSLRRIEYALPCSLYGEILNASDYKSQLIDCAAFIKRLGLNRHRGYGRCKIALL